MVKNNTKTIDLSIIIPCYNEGDILRINLYKLINFLKTRKFNYEIIIVNDGSTNNTLSRLKEFEAHGLRSKNLAAFKIISYDKNRGKGYAVKRGINKANGDYILFMDADFSTSLVEILKFWRKRNEASILIGSRKKEIVENRPIFRDILSKLCRKISQAIIPINYEDTQCGFKFFNKSVAKDIANKQRINRFAFDIEYLYIAKLNHYSVEEIPVKWTDNKHSTVHIIKDSIKFFRNLIDIRRNKYLYIK